MGSLAALALLGVMCLGSACHFWHHLTDPACGADGRHGAEQCATCSALHGGVVASDPQVSAPPALTAIAVVSPAEAAHARAPALVGGFPRAPPTA